MFERVGLFGAALALLLCGCSVGSERPFSPSSIADPNACEIGTVAMLEDGAISVSYNNGDSPPLSIRPDKAAYQGYLEFVGGLEPGQTKPLLRREGLVEMDADRSIMVIWATDGVEDPPLKIMPNAPLYDQIIRRVGNLTVGQTKSIFPTECSNRSPPQ